MSWRISNHDGAAEGGNAPSTRTARWTWGLYLQWSMLLIVSSLGLAIAAAAVFMLLIVIPLAYLFEVRLVSYAFRIPTLVIPIVWTLGIVRCYRRTPSATLLLALAMTGIAFYVVVPAAFLLIAMSFGPSL